MGDDADDARRAEQVREEVYRNRGVYGSAPGAGPLYRDTSAGFGPPVIPDPTGFEGRREPDPLDGCDYEGPLPPSNVGTTTEYGHEWGPFEFTKFERVRVAVAIREHFHRCAEFRREGALGRQVEQFEERSMAVCLQCVENIIAEDVDQAP